MSPQQTVGFVGLGNMGSRMATRLLDAGIEVLGLDVDGQAASRIGARTARDITELASSCEVILLSLPDSMVVQAVLDGPDGLVAGLRPATTVIDLGTSDPQQSVRNHARLAQVGATFIDAGISGGAAAAAAGTLTLMVGSTADVIEEYRWVTDPIASQVHAMGQPGAGHTAKVLNNFLNAVALAATSEVMVAARKSELDLDTFLDVLNGSSGVNFATLKRFPSIVHGNYLEGGLSVRLMSKDVLLYMDTVRNLGVTSFASAGCLSAFGAAEYLGYGAHISNRVVDAIGDLSGGTRVAQ